MKTFIYQNKTYEIKYGAINHLIPHEIFHCGLSVQALGLVTYIFSLPKAWRFCIAHLSKQMKISPNSCRKYLGEIFSNPTCREVFKVQEIEASMFDLEEGIYSFKDEETQQGVELWSSMLAKDVSKPNRKRVLVFQTAKQKYLLNLCFSIKDSAFLKKPAAASPCTAVAGFGLESQDDKSVRENSQAVGFCDDFGGFQAVGAGIYLGDNEQAHRAESTKSAQKPTPDKNAQNLSTIKRDSKESLKDSSSKRTREKSNNDLTSFLDLQRFSQNEQEAIKLWIRYKQESARKPFKPSQIDFQLRKITKLKEQGQDICEIIERSLNHSWQGLFPQRDSSFGLESRISSPRLCDRHPSLISAHGSKSHDSSSKILESQEIKLKTKMPKNIGGKSVLRVENV